MTLVTRHIGQSLVIFPFSPKPPEPKVIIQEVIREPEGIPEAIQEQMSRQDQEITKLEREIDLLTLALKRQTAEPKGKPALYLGRRVKE